MSEKDKQWLASALDQVVLDETRRIDQLLTIVEYEHTRTTGTTEEEMKPKTESDKEESELSDRLKKASKDTLRSMKENALEELVDRLCQIDNAKFFAIKHGGDGKLGLLMRLIGTENLESIRWRAAEVFGTVVQNNPEPQQKAIEMNAIQFFLKLLKTERNEKVATKILFALSCLMRGERPKKIIQAFVEEGGLEVLRHLLNRDDAVRLTKKILFLLMWLFQESPNTTVRTFTKGDIFRRLFFFAQRDDDLDLSEKALQVLRAIAADTAGLAALRTDPKISKALQDLLNRLRALCAKDDEGTEAARDRMRLAVAIAVALKRAEKK